MSDRIAAAIAAYQADTAPEAVKAVLQSVEGSEYAQLVTASSICWSAATTLHDVPTEEIAR
jgi:hypothetical protein